MAQRGSESLDLVFHALSDPTRRKILRTLARGDYRVSELARPHEMSLPAISKHLKVLEKARLIKRFKQGSTHTIQLHTPALKKASKWLGFYQQFWATQLDDLEELLRKTPKSTSAALRRSRRPR